MKKTSDLSDHIKRTMPKRDIQEGRESVQMFVEMLKHHKIDVVDLPQTFSGGIMVYGGV